MQLFELTANEAIKKMENEEISSEELILSCLGQIGNRESDIGAWTFLDHKKALEQAEQADMRRKKPELSSLRLNGIPVGIKDIFDTKDMPTENGTEIHKGRQTDDDAAVVKLIREAGGIIMGKTVTAELAVYTAGKTQNPHDLTRTPGGSSSGSAAAVAAGMVPLAVGTQTNGSVIRPASFCGVVGFKPTYRTIPRDKILRQSPSLDQVGVFSRSVMDSALLASLLMCSDEQYGDTLPLPSIELPQIEQSFLEGGPKLGFIKSPVWSDASMSTQERCLSYARELCPDIIHVDLPSICNQAVACHRTIMLCEMTHNYNDLHTENRDRISPMLLSMLDEGRQISLSDYLGAKNLVTEISGVIDNTLKDFDAVITPATPAEAPEGLSSTGSPIFCTLWSLSGVPAISLPLLSGDSGMPLGIQFVSCRGTDTTLLQVAHWVERQHFSDIK